jgi:hypothetical protein
MVWRHPCGDAMETAEQNRLLTQVGRGTPMGGLLLYENGARTEIELPLDQSPRDLVLAEFQDAITGKRSAPRDARWGLANLEICDAAIASSHSGAEIRLSHQVAPSA